MTVRRVGSIAELPSGLGLIVETVLERLELKREVLAAALERHPAPVTPTAPLTAFMTY